MTNSITLPNAFSQLNRHRSSHSFQVRARVASRRIQALFRGGATCLGLLAIAGTTHAQEFAANHLFVTSPSRDKVIELDQDMNHVRDITAPGLLIPHALAFGPNGNLYVGSANGGRVYEIAGDGSVVRDFAVGGGPAGLAFGQSGLLYVSSGELLIIVDIEQPTPTVVFTAATGLQLQAGTIGMDGRMLVASTEENAVLRINPEGQRLPNMDDTAGPDNLVLPQDVAIGVSGRIFVTDQAGDSVHMFTGAGLSLGSFPVPGLSDVDGITVGPDEKLWIASNNTGRIAQLDPNSGGVTIHDLSGLDAPSLAGIAWSPVRLTARVKGRARIYFTTGETEVVKIDEEIEVSYAPGSRRLMLDLEAEGESTISDLFFDDKWVLHGFELANDTDSKRFLEQTEIHPLANERGTANISLKVKGQVVGNGVYEPSKITGRLSRLKPGTAFNGTITSKERLN